ncbi:MAG: hypothetical protein SGBAC_010404 [Bacillariaceae sp.]
MLDQHDKSHRLNRRTEAVEMSALYNGYGTHYVDLWCGTPPQRQTVIVDTGSGVTAFPCSDCDRCGAPEYHTDNVFQEADSSTFSVASCDECGKGKCSDDDQCILDMYYAEKSGWSAFKAKDRCYLGGPHNAALDNEASGTDSIDPEHAKALTIDLDFGCQTRVTGLFKTQLADGIMGMEDDERSFWSQMFESGKGGSSRQFSLCFSRPEQADRGGTEAGAMTLGGTDTRLHESPMVFAKRSNSHGFYNVHVRKVYLRNGEGGESAKSLDPSTEVIPLDVEESVLNKGGVIVDSGTTDTYINSGISTQFRAVFQELSGMVYDHKKLRVKPRELETLPTILIQLEGDLRLNKQLGDDPSKVVGLAGDLDGLHPYDIILAIPPSHYMEMGSSGNYVPRFVDYEGGGGVLGANAMMGHDVLFDLENQAVGWAQSHCNYSSLVTENGFHDPLGGAVTNSEALQSSSTSNDSESKLENSKHKNSSSTLDLDSAPALDETPGSFLKPKDIKAKMQDMNDACFSWYCRLGLLTIVCTLFCFGCCLGRCCYQSRFATKYKSTELEEPKSFKDSDESSYRDEPLPDDEYGEFELT